MPAPISTPLRTATALGPYRVRDENENSIRDGITVIGFTKTTNRRETRETFENTFSPSAVTRGPVATQKGYSNRGTTRNDTGNECNRRADGRVYPTEMNRPRGTRCFRTLLRFRRFEPSNASSKCHTAERRPKSQTPTRPPGRETRRFRARCVPEERDCEKSRPRTTSRNRYCNTPDGKPVTRSLETLGNRFGNPFRGSLRAKVDFVVYHGAISSAKLFGPR